MATQALLQKRQADFNRVIRAWDRRLRFQQSLVWLPRSLLPGLALGIALAMISRLRPWLLAGQIALITGIALLAGVLVMLLIVWLWRRSTLEAARRFDVQFSLKERVSTALELINGRITAAEEIAARQLEDAWHKVGFVQASEELPLIWHLREWMLALLLAALLAALLLLPNPQAQAVEQAAAQQAAIDEAAEDLKDITEAIAADSELDEAERQQLLEMLETSIETLESPDVTPEEAFATLSDVKAALQEQADALTQRLNSERAALEQVANRLRQASAQPQVASEGASAQELSALLNELAEQMEDIDDSQRQTMQNVLQQAAQSMQSVNPQAAQQMQQAAQQLQQGNASNAQNALQQAANNMQQTAQAQQGQQNSVQQLNQAAQQAQQAANRVAQQSQQGQQPGQQQGQPQGQQSGQQGQQGQQQGGQTGQQGSSQSDQGNQNSQMQASGGGAGAGDEEGSPGESGGQQQSGQIPQNNNPDGQGEDEFEPIYDPRRIGGQGDDRVVLEPDSSDVPVAEGEFAQNPKGDVTVPYNEVFSDYSDAANRALESDYIPLGMRDVVRDYFASLEPNSSSGNAQQNGGG